MGIFAQVWFWSALAFVAGALLSWALLALPARRQLAQLDEPSRFERESTSRARPVAPPLPERTSRYDDDPLDRRRSSPFDEDPDDRRAPSPFDADDRRSSPFDEDPDDRRSAFEEPSRAPSPFASEPQSAADDDDDYDPFRSSDPAPRTELLPATPAAAEDDEAAERGVLSLGSSQSVSQPTVQVPVVGSLDEGSLFAPPEPALPDRQSEDEAAATQFLPAITAPEPVRELEAPPEVVDDRGWFQETGDGSDGDGARPAAAKNDENLVDDLAVDPRRADSAELVDDVEDIDEPADTGGTIFTQRTQPVSGDLISSLDGKSSSDTSKSEKDTEAERDESAGPILPVRKPGATRFDTGSRSRPSPPKPEPKPEIEATQAIPAATAPEAPEPERARSLFEPIVPADESATTAMPAPGAAATATRTDDGDFVPPGPFGPGSAMPLPGGGSPSSEFTVKASVTALRYCEPDSPLFGRTVAEVWFRTTKDAERVGFRPLS